MRSRRGFTLIELMIVMVIIAILVSLLMPAFARVRHRARVAKAEAEAAVIQSAVKNYFMQYGYWPGNVTQARVYPFGDRNYVDCLSHLEVDSSKNPRKVLFMEFDGFTFDAGHNYLGSPFDSKDFKSPYWVSIDGRYPGDTCEIPEGVRVTYAEP